MSLNKIIGSLATIAAFAVLVPQVNAQHEIHRGLPVIDPDGNNPDLWQPFVDTTAFPHDFQFFAPAEFGEFGGGEDPPTGWFATADRVYIYMSRPNASPAPQFQGLLPPPPAAATPSPTEGDFTWGNRFEVGYMSPENHGWFGEFWHIDGPNAFFTTEAERINVLNVDDEVNVIAPDYVDLRGGGVVMVTDQNQGVPRSDQNNPISGDRRYFIRESQNVADLTSLELNKSFRWKELHYGSHFEPFFGFRYIKYQDFWERGEYRRFTDPTLIPGGGVPVPQYPGATIVPDDFITEEFNQFINTIDNHMVGGQFGGRWYKAKGRWNLSAEVRAFLFANFQFQQSLLHQEMTFYDGFGAGSIPDAVFLNNQATTRNQTDLVFGGEARAEAAYEVTRDVAIRVGVTFTEFGRGVGRTRIGNNENVTLFGTTFGIDYRR